LLENQFQHLDVNHRDKVIQVEEIHRYKHDNLCNQLMVELENQEQEEVHHQTKKNIYIILFGNTNLDLPLLDSYILQDKFYTNDDPNHQLYDHHT